MEKEKWKGGGLRSEGGKEEQEREGFKVKGRGGSARRKGEERRRKRMGEAKELGHG